MNVLFPEWAPSRFKESFVNVRYYIEEFMEDTD